MAESMLLQDWTTAEGQAASAAVAMPAEEWPDLGACVEVVFHAEIAAWSGTGGLISLQSAPDLDEHLFLTMATVAFTAASPASRVVRLTSARPLSRWVRWRITATSAWKLTFRVWMTVRRG